MSKVKHLFAGTLAAVAVAASAPIAQAQFNCYYVPGPTPDCYDLNVDCQCIIIRDASGNPVDPPVVDAVTYRTAVGW